MPDQFWRKVQVTKWGRFEKGPNRAICSDDSSSQQISNQEFSSQKMVKGSPFVNSARLTIPNLQRISEFQGCFYLKGLSHIKQNFAFQGSWLSGRADPVPPYPCRWPLNLICPNCLPCSSSFAHFQPFHPSCHIAHYHLALLKVVRSDFWWFKFWRITWLWLGMGRWCCQARPPRLQKRRPEGRDVPASFPQSIIKSELGPAPYGLMALAGGAAEYNTASSSSQPLHLKIPSSSFFKTFY